MIKETVSRFKSTSERDCLLLPESLLIKAFLNVFGHDVPEKIWARLGIA